MRASATDALPEIRFTAMNKRVRLTNDSLNSYGYRVLTAGVDISQYQRNPVVLYMHTRGQIVGILKDIQKEDDEITAEIVFDEATDLSKRCKKQWEFGSLRMVSIGFDVIETSDAPEHIIAGQRFPTVVKSRLYEVSVVDIGANDDAIKLRKNGKLMTLGDGGDCPLPPLDNKLTNKSPQMELKALALQLGLPETADEAAVNAQLAKLKAAEEEAATLRADKEKLEEDAITAAVDTAIAERRLAADKKQQFVGLGKKLGLADLKSTLDAMAPMVKPSQLINPASTHATGGTGEKSYKKLSEVPAEEIEALKRDNEPEYRRLYKAEYGFDY
jgi:HK97 family phage prohead protease